MQIALILTALACAMCGPASLFLALRYLNARDEREAQNLRRLLVHIQAPETATALAVSDDEDETPGDLYVSFDSDEEFFAAKRDGA